MCQPLPRAAVGLGVRRALMDDLLTAPRGDFDFLECAPENWIHVGGPQGARFEKLAERHPIACHGLSLSLGGTAALDAVLLAHVATFLQRFHVPLYSEHLSFCSDDGHLHDLLPLPFTGEAVRHTAARIAQVQDILGRRIAVENVSYYLCREQDMDELAFTRAVLAEADCDLLLDINNVHVNACNHGYDADAFIAGLPAERIACLHVAGHQDTASGLKIDTHGAPVDDRVWALLARTCARIGARPALLERDCNFPPYADLRGELRMLRRVLQETGELSHA